MPRQIPPETVEPSRVPGVDGRPPPGGLGRLGETGEAWRPSWTYAICPRQLEHMSGWLVMTW